jgi:LysM repeat protein
VVKRGEDFWDIAERYKVKPSVLAKANPNVNPNRLHAGMELIVPVTEQGDKSTRREQPAPRPQPAAMIQHTVRDDETFYSISRRYGIGMDAVVAANPDVRPERLRSGMKVWVPSKSAPAPQLQSQPPPKTAATTPRGSVRAHVVKENESIASIAKKYGVSETALLRENKLAEDDAIYVDDTLKIPSAGTAVASSAPVPAKPAAPSSKPQPPAPQPKPAGNTPPNTVGSDGAIRSYIVSAGEDENTICEAFGISKQALFSYNHLSATTKLKPGDEIAIPRVARGKR